jgi:PAS domain S-box-containing protein
MRIIGGISHEDAMTLAELLYWNASDGHIFFTEDLIPIDCNPAFVKIFGISPEERPLRDFWSFSPEYQNSGVASADKFQEILRTASNGEQFSFEWTQLGPDGREIPCHFTLVRVNMNDRTGYLSYVRDMRIHRNVELELTRQIEQMRNILNSSPTAMVILKDMIVQNSNYGALSALGLRQGDHFGKVYADSRQRLHVQKELRLGKEIHGFQAKINTSGRGVIEALVTIRPFTYRSEKMLIAWISDISEPARARALAEESAAEKRRMLTNMIHEILTPLRAVMGVSRLCMQTELTEKQTGYVVGIQSAARVMLSQMDDVMNSFEGGCGDISVRKTVFHLNDMLDLIRNLTQFKAMEKDLTFCVNVAPDTPPAFAGDPLRITQILMALCDNSIRFTEKGSLSLDIDYRESGEGFDAGELRFVIRDTGVGMTAEQLNKIFDHSAGADIARKQSGRILNIPNANRLAEMMGGWIEAESEPGRGSVFTVVIKLEVARDLDSTGASLENQFVPSGLFLVQEEQMNAQVAAELTNLLETYTVEIGSEIAASNYAQTGA